MSKRVKHWLAVTPLVAMAALLALAFVVGDGESGVFLRLIALALVAWAIWGFVHLVSED